ncbi:phage tail protein [Pseudomonas jessenii]|uniref:phage tail protein n=1 Tax=Pseudomonas jessenii TaxID=77298 RepID=UPI0030BA3FC7
MPWYRSGTVAVTSGSTTVTGTSTAFAANSRVGDAFQGPDGRWYEVTNIASTTVLSILPAYQGATASGGAYALAPMQGYVKESADRLRQLVDQWGATLAGLGTVSVENVVPVAKGGTGGTTAALARSGLGLGAAAVAAILGTVSQSGGVPTGAIVEKVVNANGEATKFADGRLICTGPIADFTVAAGAVATVSPLGVFPVLFADTAYTYQAFGTPQSSLDVYGYTTDNSRANWSAKAVYRNGPTAQTISGGRYLAIGRWF